VATSPEIDILADTEENEEENKHSKVVIRDQISHIFELVPTVPKLQRLDAMLKGCEYDEGHERDDAGSDEDLYEVDKEKERAVRVFRFYIEININPSSSENAPASQKMTSEAKSKLATANS